MKLRIFHLFVFLNLQAAIEHLSKTVSRSAAPDNSSPSSSVPTAVGKPGVSATISPSPFEASPENSQDSMVLSSPLKYIAQTATEDDAASSKSYLHDHLASALQVKLPERFLDS